MGTGAVMDWNTHSGIGWDKWILWGQEQEQMEFVEMGANRCSLATFYFLCNINDLVGNLSN